jgi:hypothetical protein
MARLRFLVVCTAVIGMLAAVGLSAAEKNAAKTPAEKPRRQVAVDMAPDPFAEAGTPKAPAKSPQKPAARQRPRPVIQQTPWRPGEAEAKIEAALASRTELDFTEAPLQDVVDYLKDYHRIEIQIDRRVLEDVNVTTETPVTINIKGVSLESALRLMLRNMQPELTYMIKNEVLLITTPDIAAEELLTKLYDVADLVVYRDEHDALFDDYDPLIDIIMSTVMPTTWDDVGAPGSATGYTLGTAKVLAVTQTRIVHQEINSLLAKIREIGKKNPSAGIPRRSRPAQSLGHNARLNGLLGGGNAHRPGGAPAAGAAPKPTEKPGDAVKPAEQKPPTSKPA